MRAARVMTRLTIVATTAFALLLGGAAAAHGAPEAVPELEQTAVTGKIDYRVGDLGQLPVLDSEVGLGARLGTDETALIALGQVAAGHDSALVRISVLSPAQDTTVFRSGGSPALHTAAGVSASTTVLLPIDTEGRAQLWANTPVQTRLEVLAAFTGQQNQPGSTIALVEPIQRADTRSGLAGERLGSAPLTVGLLGQGGVPSERVRAVYVTATVELAADGVLVLGAQRMPLPAGSTTFTTIIAPGANGATEASVEGTAGQLDLQVIGWMPEAPEQGTQLSLEGSFVPTSRLSESFSQTVREGRDDFQTLTRNADAVYSIGLVGLAPTAETETTLFEFGPAYAGRAHGAVVDRARGAAPQLVLVPATEDGDGFTLRRGAARLNWLPVGDILGAERARPSADLAVGIDSHRPGQRIDLGQHGYFTLAGAITSSSEDPSIDRVEVFGPAGLIGRGDVFVEHGALRWSFDASAPESGAHEYRVEAYDRGGNRAETRISLDIEAFDDEDIVIAPDLWVLNDDPAVPEARIVADEPDTVYVVAAIPLAPGDTLVSDATPQLPEGLFVEVASFDRIGGEWRVQTRAARFEDVFFQVSMDEVERLDDELSGTVIDDSAGEARFVVEDEHGAEVVGETERLAGDAGYAVAEVVTGSAVDVDPLVCEYDPDQLPAPDSAHPECAGDGAAGERTVGRRAAPFAPQQVVPAGLRPAASLEISQTLGFNANITLLSGERTLGQSPKMKDIAKSSENPDEVLNSEFREMTKKDEAGLVLGLAAQISPKLEFVLETHMTWKWGFIPTGVVVDKFKVQFTVTAKGKVSLQIFYKLQQTLKVYNKIGAFKLPTITFGAGPVPVVIFNEIEMALQTQTKLQATLTTTLHYTEVDTWGIEYSGSTGKWKSLDKPTKVTHSPLTLNPIPNTELKFAGELSTGPVITAKSKIYGVAGPELSVSAAVGIGGTLIFSEKEAYAQLAIFARLTAGAKVKFELFSFKAEVEIWGEEWRFDFWKGRHYFWGEPVPQASGTARAGAGSGPPQPA